MSSIRNFCFSEKISNLINRKVQSRINERGFLCFTRFDRRRKSSGLLSGLVRRQIPVGKKNPALAGKWWLRQESNLYQKFRKLLFYPLNYGANSQLRDYKNSIFFVLMRRAIPLPHFTLNYPAPHPSSLTVTLLPPSASQRLIHIHPRVHLLHFCFHQLKLRLKRVALGHQHFHIIRACGFEKCGGDIN